MRILYLHDYADLADAPMYQLQKLRAAAERAGHETQLVASDAVVSNPPDYAPATLCRGHRGRAQVVAQVLNPSAIAAVRRTIARFRPDLVHLRMAGWQLSPLVIRAVGDLPVLYQACIYKAVCPNGRKLLPDGSPCTYEAGAACLREGCLTPQTFVLQMMQRRLIGAVQPRIRYTTALSRRMADVLERFGWPVDEVIPNGVEMAARRPPLGEAAVLGYAGRLDREKGVFVLLDAAARLAARGPLKLLIAGDGPDAAALKTRSAELGLDVRFTGHLGRAEMEAALAPAWVQVVPSLWEEPFGNVTTEAMMRGTAVVASNGGGQAEIVKDGVTGRLVPPGNAEALAGALSPYTKDRALAEAHGEAGRQRAIDAFSDQATQRRYLALYEDLLA